MACVGDVSVHAPVRAKTLKVVNTVLKIRNQPDRHLANRTGITSTVLFAVKPAVFPAILLVFIVLGGCSGEEQQARELMKQRQAEQQFQSAGSSPGSDIELLAMRLTDSVIAEKAEGSEAWYVSRRDSKSYVKLPFQPTANAKLSSAKSNQAQLIASEQPETGSLGDGDSPDASAESRGSGFRSLAQLKQAISLKNANPGFMGAKVCGECHQDRHGSFVHTAHHLTSGWMPDMESRWYNDPEPTAKPAENESVGNVENRLGSDQAMGESSKELPVHGVYAWSQLVNGFVSPLINGSKQDHHLKDPSVMSSSDPELSFQMLYGPEGFSQRVSLADYEVTLPVHVFTGSAKAGQTFLYWHGQRLYQSFVSYLTDLDQWIPSPGYFDTTADYTREIGTTCLECHVTYIDRGYERGTLKPDTAVWGISCERCHGPGQKHVEHHRSVPDDRVAKFIAQPADLPRQRQLDICSQCHSGSESLMTGKFDFRPGMEVEKKKLRSDSESGVGGVHTANQLNRLALSSCFQQSEMTCTTCHDPHVNQRGQREVFSQSCLKCHQVGHCGMADEVGEQATKNCIDCHMPTGDNDQMTIEVGGGDLFTVRMIDHHIRVDRSATERFLREIESPQKETGEREAN